MTAAAIIGFIAVCILASVAGWAALRVSRYLVSLDMPDSDGETR